ncbi:hypothetical protein CsSME_00037886 [Camellia sinensis var. sinensis]
MEATTIPFSTLTSAVSLLILLLLPLLHFQSTKPSPLPISSSWAASTLSVAFSSRNSFTREIWGLLNSKAEMFGHLTMASNHPGTSSKEKLFPTTLLYLSLPLLCPNLVPQGYRGLHLGIPYSVVVNFGSVTPSFDSNVLTYKNPNF